MDAYNIDTSIPWEERNKIREEENGYTWDNVKNRNIKTIGKYWQAGIGAGIVDMHMIWYVYFGEPSKNDTFFTVAEITEQEYLDLCDKYKEFLYNDKVGIPSRQVSDDIVKGIKEYVLHSKIIMEGWYLL